MADDRLDWTAVYVISADGGNGQLFSKIGMSRDVQGRLSSLQNASPLPLKLFTAIGAPSRQLAESIERGAHASLEKYRSQGEWFSCAPVIAGIAICISAEATYQHVGITGDKLYDFMEKTGVVGTLQGLLESGGHL